MKTTVSLYPRHHRLSVPATARRTPQPGTAFARYAICMINARGNPERALRLAKTHYPEERGLHMILASPFAGDTDMLFRAAVPGAAISDPAWAGALVQYQDIATDFINYLRPMTILGRFGTDRNGITIPALKPAPFNTRVKRQTTGGSAGWVGEGQPTPLTSWSLDFVLLDYAKCASIAVLTQEMARFGSPGAEGLVRDELAAAIAQQLDKDFVDPTNAGTSRVKPAAITHGATTRAASGTTADDVRSDVGYCIEQLANAFIPYNRAVWIANSMTTIQLYLMRNALGQREFPDLQPDGGLLEGRPVIVSNDDVATGSPLTADLVLCVPQEIYLSDDGNIAIDVSTEASLEMSDTPANSVTGGSPPTPTATSMVSMFQTNAMAVRAEREINWLLRRAAACVYISGCAYAA
jgi:HK97 family phage major capsid protein